MADVISACKNSVGNISMAYFWGLEICYEMMKNKKVQKGIPQSKYIYMIWSSILLIHHKDKYNTYIHIYSI